MCGYGIIIYNYSFTMPRDLASAPLSVPLMCYVTRIQLEMHHSQHKGNTCVVCKLRAVIGHTQLAVFTASSL